MNVKACPWPRRLVVERAIRPQAVGWAIWGHQTKPGRPMQPPLPKLLHSPSSFRLLCPPQLPPPLLSYPCRCQLFCSARSHRSTVKKNVYPVNPICVHVWGEWDRDVKEHWWQNGTRKRRCQRRFSPRRANFILLSR